MALPPVARRFVDGVTARLGLGPIRKGSPEDSKARPLLDQVVSREPGRSFIPESWMGALETNPDTVLNNEGGGLEVFDDLLDDDVVYSTLQQRRLAITSRDWEVAPGDSDDPRSVLAADDLRAMLKHVGWDRVTGLIHYAVFYGYAVAEAMYVTKRHDGRLIIWLDDILVPDRRWFGFSKDGQLRMLDATGVIGGEELPPNKFWTVRTGGTHDFAFYGMGLAHWCYWPVFFKRSGIKFWALFLEKFGKPTVAIEYAEGDDDSKKSSRLLAAQAIGQDSAVLLPPDTITKDLIKIMEATRAGTGSYREFKDEQNEALMRVVLGQPGTSKATPGGLGGDGQAKKDEGVKREIVKADSDLISETFGQTIAKWLTTWNHGEDVAPPTVYRVLDDPDDVDTLADRDVKLDGIGIKRTDDSVKEVYGDGYERIEPPKPVIVPPVAGLPAPANDDDAATRKVKLAARAAEFGVSDVAPLYVRRDLLPASRRALKAWAKDQGFATLVPDADFHVTVLYSKAAVDWFDMGTAWAWDSEFVVGEGGPRKVEQLGDDGAIVLRFASAELKYRHESMLERGASSDYPDYLPHVTFTYDGGDVDLAKVKPFTGELRFGPEVFEPIRDKPIDPDALQFDAGEVEAIDRLVATLASDTSPAFAAMAEEMRAGLQGVKTVEGARVALIEAFERMRPDTIANRLGLSLLAARTTAAVGDEDAIGG